MSPNKRKEMQIFLVVFGLAVVTLASVVLYSAINRDFQLYQQESKCVQKYIAQGVERRNIETDGGTCYVKSNKS